MDANSVLEQRATTFAAELSERLARILPNGNPTFTVTATPQRDGTGRFGVGSAEPEGIYLTIDNVPRLQLEVDYELILSPVSQFPVTLKSSFLVRVAGEGRPLFTVDYVRGARSNTPAAHYNFHFAHDELTAQLLATGRARRGRLHQRGVAQGNEPRLADLHFIVGGHRFRPCLEDIIDMLSAEFGIDLRAGAHEAIEEGRREWRAVQLRAAVSDDPVAAIAELERLGYDVTWRHPAMPKPTERLDRLHSM